MFLSMKSVGLLFKKVEVCSSMDCLLHQDAFHLSWLTKIKGLKENPKALFKLFNTGGAHGQFIYSLSTVFA